MFLSTVDNQYLVGASSPSGHSISSVSCGRSAARLIGAVRTWTRAKRERKTLFVPSRHVIVRQACFGSVRAKLLALIRVPSLPPPQYRLDLNCWNDSNQHSG